MVKHPKTDLARTQENKRANADKPNLQVLLQPCHDIVMFGLDVRRVCMISAHPGPLGPRRA